MTMLIFTHLILFPCITTLLAVAMIASVIGGYAKRAVMFFVLFSIALATTIGTFTHYVAYLMREAIL
jgi:hypothetical protein